MTKSMTSTSKSRPEGVVVGHYILNSILTVLLFTPYMLILDSVSKHNKSIILLIAERASTRHWIAHSGQQTQCCIPSYPGGDMFNVPEMALLKG